MDKVRQPTTVYWIENKLYLNITNRCSNNCFFCLKKFKRGVGDFHLKFVEDPCLERIISDVEGVLWMRKWDELVFCGFGEPTERLDVLLAVTRWVRERCGMPIKIRLNTNGHGCMLNEGRNVAVELKVAGVDAVSVSLNAGDEETYREICKPIFEGAYEGVLDFIRKAKSVLKVEATAVRMPEVDLTKANQMAEDLGVDFRIREYIPCFY